MISEKRNKQKLNNISIIILWSQSYYCYFCTPKEHLITSKTFIDIKKYNIVYGTSFQFNKRIMKDIIKRNDICFQRWSNCIRLDRAWSNWQSLESRKIPSEKIVHDLRSKMDLKKYKNNSNIKHQTNVKKIQKVIEIFSEDKFIYLTNFFW